MKLFWDISAPMDETSPVFPGDTPYQQHWVAQLQEGAPVNVCSITLSPHLGTHADAPLHYDPQGLPIGEVDLEPFLGICWVFHVEQGLSLIEPTHLEQRLDEPCFMGKNMPQRVLIRTYFMMPQTQFDAHLPALAPTTVDWLAKQGVRLVGVDSASLDPAQSKTLDSHQRLRYLNMRVLENLVLDEVPEGVYELIALPLKLMKADASPVRAILRRIQ